jgi:hypothetical protein
MASVAVMIIAGKGEGAVVESMSRVPVRMMQLER